VTVEIVLSKGQVALVDESDLALVSVRPWHMSSNGYARGSLRVSEGGPSVVYMHRVILGLERWDGLEADHINRNTLDTRRSNLRVCTHAENTRNCTPRSGKKHSTFKGVTNLKGRWQCQIGGQHIGYFDTEREAARAYDEHARIRFGEFAATNESQGLL
jgi:hypothetical protein